MTDTNQLPPLPTLQPGDSHMESLIEAAIQGHADTREAMRWLVRQLVPATQPAEVTDEQIESEFQQCGGKWNGDQWVIEDADLHPFVRAILALRPVQVPMTDGYGDDEHGWTFAIGRELEAQEKRLMSLLVKAFGSRHPAIDDMAHLILTRPAHHGITAQAKKEEV